MKVFDQLQNQYGVRSLYMMGGWQIQFVPDFHRLTFNDTTNQIQMDPQDGAWQQLMDLNEARFGFPLFPPQVFFSRVN